MASKPTIMKPYDAGDPVQLPSVRFRTPCPIAWEDEADERVGVRMSEVDMAIKEIPPNFPVRARKGDSDTSNPPARPDPFPFKGLTDGRGK